MENMRIYVTSAVPEAALTAIDALQGVSAGEGLITGAGESRPQENSLVLFYQAEGAGKGEVRIPFSSIALVDEGVHHATMKRTMGVG